MWWYEYWFKNDYAYYLCLILNEFYINLTANIVAKSANSVLGLVMAKCNTICGVNWRNKLKSYKRFKFEYGVENYCKVLVPFKDSSAFAKFMCGVAPIRLETGHYENIKRKKDAVLTVQL